MRGVRLLDPSAQQQLELERGLHAVTRLVEHVSLSSLSRHQREWAIGEIRKAIRDLQWEVDDYQYTLEAIEREPHKYILTDEDLLLRKRFALSTKDFVEEVKTHVLPSAACGDYSKMAAGGYRYSRLADEDEQQSSSGETRFHDILGKQEQIIREQDDDLELVGKSMSTLKNMSMQIGDELEQQSGMLDSLGAEMDHVDSKLEAVTKKITRLAHLDDDKRQCKVLIILSVILFFLIIILIL